MANFQLSKLLNAFIILKITLYYFLIIKIDITVRQHQHGKILGNFRWEYSVSFSFHFSQINNSMHPLCTRHLYEFGKHRLFKHRYRVLICLKYRIIIERQFAICSTHFYTWCLSNPWERKLTQKEEKMTPESNFEMMTCVIWRRLYLSKCQL